MSERDAYPTTTMREAIGKRRIELGNTEETIYCDWTGVDCPAPMHQPCDSRPSVEKLHLEQDQAESNGDYERGSEIEEQLDDIALKNCEFEKFIGQEFEEFDL